VWRRNLLFADVEGRRARIQGRWPMAQIPATAFRVKRGVGRERALKKLKQIFNHADFCYADLNIPIAVWSFLKACDPRDWLPDDAPSLYRQRCLRTYYLIVDENGVHSALWGAEFTAHAIGRLVSDSRSPLSITALEAISEGHKNLLGASAEAVMRWPADFLIHAADGFFRCEAELVEAPFGRQLFVRSTSWLHSNQLHADQHPIPPAVEVEDRLGHELLLPMTLRRRAAA
jgi:hypothetical protein